MKILLEPNIRLYKYTLLRFINDGQFGDLWIAKDETLDTEVALKIINFTGQNLAPIIEEAKQGHKFEHQNLIRVHYADVIAYKSWNLALIAMEYMRNGDITRELNARQFLSVPRVVEILRDVLTGLEYLHSRSFIHNDVKPSNILVGNHREGILTDYGITGFAPNGSVPAKNGYLQHMAPETQAQAHMPISIQSDIYQTGITGYRLLNGISSISNHLRHAGLDQFKIDKCKGKIPDPKGYLLHIPPRLRNIINKACEVDTGKRYHSALQMRRELEKVQFPGYWTINSRGNYLGVGSKWEYRFEKIAKPGGTLDLIAWKKNIQSNREIKFGDFSKSNLTIGQCEKEIAKLMKWVNENAK